MYKQRDMKNLKKEIKKIFQEDSIHLEKISLFIDEHLVPKNIEKEKNAEVSTPYPLRQDMLNSIPKSFWKNPQNRVFEPCCGKGGFIIDIISRFMEGLKEKIKDSKKRYEHILKNQVYFADINKKNIEIVKILINPDNKYVTNGSVGDTLKIDIKKTWKIDGFDAVIGNPPYSVGQETTGKKGGGDLLWNKFVIEGLEKWLLKDGYLLYVHPSGWRKPPSDKSKYMDLFDLMTHKNQMIYLEIHNTEDGMKVFKCGTRYDWYLIQKRKGTKKTEVKDEKGKIQNINLLRWDFLPNYDMSMVEKLLKKKDSVEILYSRSAYGSDKDWVNEKKTKLFKYPLIHSTTKKGIRYMYSKTNKNGFFGIPKVIFGESGINQSAILDMTGKYGMTQQAMAITDVKGNLPKIKKSIESNEFQEILDACSWSNFRIDWRLFTYMKKDFWKQFL
jgi:hypothetical protein